MLHDAALADAVITDTEAAIALGIGEAPPGALVTPSAGCQVPCIPVHALYAMLHDRTATDNELERLRCAGIIRMIRMPASGDERLILRAEDYLKAMKESNCEAAANLTATSALSRCTGVRVLLDELAVALHSQPDSCRRCCEELVGAGWLTPAHAETFEVEPNEAPRVANDRAWLWSLPLAGRLIFALSKCRAEVLSVLHKQHFHRAMRHIVERAPSVRKALASSRLDMRFVLRDITGKGLVAQTATAGGTVLELTPMGLQAANSAMARRGRKRSR